MVSNPVTDGLHLEVSLEVDFFLVFRLNFEIIIDSDAVVRLATERACVPFTHFPPVVTSGRTRDRHHHQDIGFDAESVEQEKDPSCWPLVAPSPHP